MRSVPNCWFVLHDRWLSACSHNERCKQCTICSVIYIMNQNTCPRSQFVLYNCSGTVSMSHLFGKTSIGHPASRPLKWPQHQHWCPLDKIEHPWEGCSPQLYHSRHRGSTPAWHTWLAFPVLSVEQRWPSSALHRCWAKHLSTPFGLRHWSSQPRLSLLPRRGRVALQGRKDHVLPSQRLELVSSGFLSGASRGREASRRVCLPTSQTCPRGAASAEWPWKEDRNALWGRIQHCHAWCCWCRGRGHRGTFGWWLESVPLATTFWMQKAQGHSRSTHAFIYGGEPCPCPHWSHCSCYLCLGRWNACVLGYTGELVPHMADCSDRAESTRWGIHLCVAVAGLVTFFFPTGLCSPSLMVFFQHNYNTQILPYSAEAKKIE